MNETKDIQYPPGFDKESSEEEEKQISDQFFKAYFDAQEPIETRVKTDTALFSDHTADDDDDYPDDGDDNYTADDDDTTNDDDDDYTDDDDDNYTDDDTIKVIPMEQFVHLRIEYAHEVAERAADWQGELLSSQNSVKLAEETYDYVLRASLYAGKAWADSFEKATALNYQALLCCGRVVRANVAFKRLGHLSAHGASVCNEAQDADSMLKEALKSYDNEYRLSIARHIVWRNTKAITADAYQKLSLAKKKETEASAACMFWLSKTHDALVAPRRASDYRNDDDNHTDDDDDDANDQQLHKPDADRAFGAWQVIVENHPGYFVW